MKFMVGISTVLAVLVFGWTNFMVSEQLVPVPAFNSIHANGPINVYIQRGNEDKVVIRADDNVHDKVTVEVVEGQLRIFNNAFIQGERVLDAYVTYRALDSIDAAGASTVTSRSMLDTERFKLVARGAAEVRLQINCQNLDLDMQGVANVFLAGTADQFDFSISHVGDLTAYNFDVLNCNAQMITGDQSPGIARINVSKALAVHIEGPRHLYYRGSPEISSQVIKGRGKLIQK